MDEREQRAVRVSEPERQPARFVRDVEVKAELEAVKRLEHGTERQKAEQRPPAEAKVLSGERFDG